MCVPSNSPKIWRVNPPDFLDSTGSLPLFNGDLSPMSE